MKNLRIIAPERTITAEANPDTPRCAGFSRSAEGAVLFAMRTIRKMRSRDEVCVEAALLELSKALAEARTLRDAIPERVPRGQATRGDVREQRN